MEDGVIGGSAGWTTRTATGGSAPGTTGRSSSLTRLVKLRPTAFAMSAARWGDSSVTVTSMSTDLSALDAVIRLARSSGVSASLRFWTTSWLTRVLLTSAT
jgi:hypothetical protein